MSPIACGRGKSNNANINIVVCQAWCADDSLNGLDDRVDFSVKNSIFFTIIVDVSNGCSGEIGISSTLWFGSASTIINDKKNIERRADSY
jgi:hypothetical protein